MLGFGLQNLGLRVQDQIGFGGGLRGLGLSEGRVMVMLLDLA